jgi:hypothetical protein
MRKLLVVISISDNMDTPITHYTLALDSLTISLRCPDSGVVDFKRLTLQRSQQSYIIGSTTLSRLDNCPVPFYRLAYKVTVNNQMIGTLYMVPTKPEVWMTELVSFTFENCVLYGYWLDKYHEFIKDTNLKFNSYSKIDIACDSVVNLSELVIGYIKDGSYHCNSLRNPVCEDNIGHFNNPILNELETIYIGKRGKQCQPIGSSTLKLYNKTKLLKSESKEWISDFHNSNGLVGTVYRAEVSLTNRAITRTEYCYSPIDLGKEISVYEYKKRVASNPKIANEYKKLALKQAPEMPIEALADSKKLQGIFANYFKKLLDIRFKSDSRFSRCKQIEIFDFDLTQKLVVNHHNYLVSASKKTNIKCTIRTIVSQAKAINNLEILSTAQIIAKMNNLEKFYENEYAHTFGLNYTNG